MFEPCAPAPNPLPPIELSHLDSICPNQINNMKEKGLHWLHVITAEAECIIPHI